MAKAVPEKVFRLDDESVLPYLDVLGEVTGGAALFEEDALTRRALRRPDFEFDPLSLLESYYRA